MRTPTSPLPVLLMAGHDTSAPRTRRGRKRGPALPAPKALIDVAGRPMIAWVLDALRASPRVGAITVAGLARTEADLGDGIVTLPNRPGMVENGLAGLRAVVANNPAADHVLVAQCDTPLLTPEAVTWFVDACAPRTADLYMAIAARATVEAAFPHAPRTWLRTRAGGFCSADLFLVRPAAIFAQETHLRALLAQRKRPLGLVRTVGAGWLLRFLLGRVHPDDLRTAAQQWAGLQARAVILPFAGAAMDVDKPVHLELARAALAAQPSRAP